MIHEGKETTESFQYYIISRKNITDHIMSSELKEWDKFTSENENDLWRKIDWKGEINKSTQNIHPPINQLKEHFANIYTSDDDNLKDNLINLSSNIYIPILDDPIRNAEVHDGVKKCKKGRYDFPITTVKNFTLNFLPIILRLWNIFFLWVLPTKTYLFLIFQYTQKREPSTT